MRIWQWIWVNILFAVETESEVNVNWFILLINWNNSDYIEYRLYCYWCYHLYCCRWWQWNELIRIQWNVERKCVVIWDSMVSVPSINDVLIYRQKYPLCGCLFVCSFYIWFSQYLFYSGFLLLCEIWIYLALLLVALVCDWLSKLKIAHADSSPFWL